MRAGLSNLPIEFCRPWLSVTAAGGQTIEIKPTDLHRINREHLDRS
jgi:hypothetical protein